MWKSLILLLLVAGLLAIFIRSTDSRIPARDRRAPSRPLLKDRSS